MTQKITQRFSVLTAVYVRVLIFWHVTPRRWLGSSQRFEGTQYLHNVGDHSPSDTTSRPGSSKSSDSINIH